MTSPRERKLVLITRRTRLEELLVRYHSVAQARFYIEHLGADFSDYVAEHDTYGAARQTVLQALEAHGRYQVLDRVYLPNFVFAADDVVLVLGQDGLVANTVKYLDGQSVIGVNPDPKRWDGVLLPFLPQDLASLLPDVLHKRRRHQNVTMAEATLSDGQRLLAVNDLFIGTRSHTSARYEIRCADHQELQSSSGLIVATGLGSTAWIKSIITGARVIAGVPGPDPYPSVPWDAPYLQFAVREPFPSRASQATLVFGRIDAGAVLSLRSLMPEHGVIFSDGIEADFLAFNSGLQARIGLAARQGRIVV